jgi:hypothetical protein
MPYLDRMNDLTDDTRCLADDLRASATTADSLERRLLVVLEPFLQTLEIDGSPQRGSTDKLSRFCTDCLDWSSPLFARCKSVIERANAQL